MWDREEREDEDVYCVVAGGAKRSALAYGHITEKGRRRMGEEEGKGDTYIQPVRRLMEER